MLVGDVVLILRNIPPVTGFAVVVVVTAVVLAEVVVFAAVEVVAAPLQPGYNAMVAMIRRTEIKTYNFFIT
jgi:hypothetical protein